MPRIRLASRPLRRRCDCSPPRSRTAPRRASSSARSTAAAATPARPTRTTSSSSSTAEPRPSISPAGRSSTRRRRRRAGRRRALTGSIGPGRYYLVQLASTASVGSPLPAADATGTTNLASTGGKIALVRDATALTCGATAGSCASAPLVEDLVGYGSATDYEGAGPAPALEQHDRRAARRRRLHRHERERDRLHRRRAGAAQRGSRRQPRARAGRRRARRRARPSTSTCSRCCRSRSSGRA